MTPWSMAPPTGARKWSPTLAENRRRRYGFGVVPHTTSQERRREMRLTTQTVARRLAQAFLLFITCGVSLQATL
jgi:hypothetical protein